MKITANREKLLHAFQIVASVVPTRSTKTILQRIRFDVTPDEAILMATDTEVGIRFQVPGIEVDTPGSVLLPVAKFSSILRESSDESVQLEATSQGTKVIGSRSRFTLAAEDPHEFPIVAKFEESSHFSLGNRLLRELIRRTISATETESSRYALGGIKLEVEGETLTAIATDGRRLARMEGAVQSNGEPLPFGESTIVPTAAMQLIERAFTADDQQVSVAVRQNEVLVRDEHVTVYARLLDGRFPRWRDVFPQRNEATQISLVVGPVLSAVRQAAIVTNKESRGISFHFTEGSLILSGQSAEVGQARIELPVEEKSTEQKVTLDPRFVIDFLRVLDSDHSFTLELEGSDEPVVCSTGDGYAYVIMPLAQD